MPIDFSDLFNDDNDDGLTIHPREIFSGLHREPDFAFPRDIQTEVMNQWYGRRDEQDTVIKLNVGSGKTLVGLLLLQSSLNERKGPALYVTPTKQLVKQVMEEADSLGIDITDDPKCSDYHGSKKICVVTVQRLFNGRSIFGVGMSKLKIGTVIIDDAHACVSSISDQFRLVVRNQAYKDVLSVIENDLLVYCEWLYHDIKRGDPFAYIEVPFWIWELRQSEIMEALRKHEDDEDIMFPFLLLRNFMSLCRCVVGGDRLEVEPCFPVLDLFHSFRRANRRIYMTATLSDDSVLVTHFGAKLASLGQPIVPISSQSMGTRMILMPQELNPNFTIDEIRALLSKFVTQSQHNVVVIVPSNRSAMEWNEVATQTLVGENVADGVESLRNGNVEFTILVNRYDGIDLPDNACRILVIADLPETVPLVDLVDSILLDSSSMNLRRQIERIEQGMGRGVRSNSDYCVVLLVGSRLIGRVHSPDGYELLTHLTQRQVDVSQKVAKKLKSPTIEELEDVIQKGIEPDLDWIKFSRKALSSIKIEAEIQIDSAKLAVKLSFDLARDGKRKEAIKVLDDTIENTSESSIKAWLLCRKAAFQHKIDSNAAQITLREAHSIEPCVLKPIDGIEYQQLIGVSENQVNQLIVNHRKLFSSITDMQLYSNTLCADLDFKPNLAKKFESAIDNLARFIGITGQRPEIEYNEGPDNLWVLDDNRFLVIECKSGVTTDRGVSKREVAQLGQSVEWFKKRYPHSSHVPIIIHPNRYLEPRATSLDGMRVIDRTCLNKLRMSLQDFTTRISNQGGYDDVSGVGRCVSQSKLNKSALVDTFTKVSKSHRN